MPDLDALIDEPDEWESAVAALWCQTGSEQNVPDSPEDAAHLASLIHRYSGPLRQENSCLRSALDSSVNAEMRVLMVLVSDSIISQDRAREIAGMTHEEQREHWRREHKTALTEGVAKAVAPLVSMLESIKSQTKEEGTHAMASIALFDAKRGNG